MYAFLRMPMNVGQATFAQAQGWYIKSLVAKAVRGLAQGCQPPADVTSLSTLAITLAQLAQPLHIAIAQMPTGHM